MRYIREWKEWQEDQELARFLAFCKSQLGYSREPDLVISDDHAEASQHRAMGYYSPMSGHIWVLRGARTTADWYRTLAHELVHHAQRELGQVLDGRDGSPTENEANSKAGILLREWGRLHPQIFS